MAIDEGWMFEAWRVCPYCKGTGNEPQPSWRPGGGPNDVAGTCRQCFGDKKERATLSVGKLRELLGL